MRVKKNTITINGRTYDSSTGVPVDGRTIIRPTPSPVAKKPDTTRSQSKRIPVSSGEHKPSKAHSVGVSVGRKPDKSQTLMRTTVKRPTSAKAPAHSVAGLTSQPKRIVVSVKGATEQKQSLRSHTKSPLVSKFGSSAQHHSSVTPQVKHIPVAKPPAHSSHSVRTAAKGTYDISNIPPAPNVPVQAPLKELHRDLFETALQGASSHKAKRLKKPKVHRSRAAKLSRIGASALTVLLLIAFFGYQNAPRIALMRASNTIGFDARVPGYSPAGFRQSGPILYSSGKVSISFRSNTDSRQYNVTQVATDMDSKSLATSYLQGKDYQKVSSGGHASYIYDRSNITWVKNGVWYNVTSNTNFSEDQLVNIASSL